MIGLDKRVGRYEREVDNNGKIRGWEVTRVGS